MSRDNPRGEEPAEDSAAPSWPGPGAVEVDDRRAAIAAAIAELRQRRCAGNCRQGHEPVQIVGNEILPFDDAVVAGELLAASAGALMLRGGLSPSLDAAMPNPSGRVGRIVERCASRDAPKT